MSTPTTPTTPTTTTPEVEPETPPTQEEVFIALCMAAVEHNRQEAQTIINAFLKAHAESIAKAASELQAQEAQEAEESEESTEETEEPPEGEGQEVQ